MRHRRGSEDQVEDATGSDVQVWVTIQCVLHILLVEFPIDLGSGTLKAYSVPLLITGFALLSH